MTIKKFQNLNLTCLNLVTNCLTLLELITVCKNQVGNHFGRHGRTKELELSVLIRPSFQNFFPGIHSKFFCKTLVTVFAKEPSGFSRSLMTNT